MRPTGATQQQNKGEMLSNTGAAWPVSPGGLLAQPLYITLDRHGAEDQDESAAPTTVLLAVGDGRGGLAAAVAGAERVVPVNGGHTGAVKPQCDYTWQLQEEIEKEEYPGWVAGCTTKPSGYARGVLWPH